MRMKMWPALGGVTFARAALRVVPAAVNESTKAEAQAIALRLERGRRIMNDCTGAGSRAFHSSSVPCAENGAHDQEVDKLVPRIDQEHRKLLSAVDVRHQADRHREAEPEV